MFRVPSLLAATAVAATLLVPANTQAAFPDAAKTGLEILTHAEGFLTPTKRTLAPLGYVRLCKSGALVCEQRQGSLKTTADKRVILTGQLRRELDLINASVNRFIKPKDDPKNQPDIWTVGATSGDCEDYVLSKKHELMSRGWPSSALLISVVRTRLGANHAVLIVRTDRGDLILDNLSRRVKNIEKTAYTYKAIQSPTGGLTWYSVS